MSYLYIMEPAPLFMPCQEKYLSNFVHISAQTIIFDLEDSIKHEQKQIALELLTKFLDSYNGGKNLWVRVDRERYAAEISVLRNKHFEGFMIPKTESPQILEDVAELAEEKRLWPLVETPLGIVNIEPIVKHPGVCALMFGGEDYSTYFTDDVSPELIRAAKNRLVLYGCAYDLPVFDTISWNYNDMQLLKKEVIESKRLGFSGKAAIHPNQLNVINKIFEQKQEDFSEIIALYDNCISGVLNYKGKIYEKPHVDYLKKRMNNIG